jgi:CheY-like chemotaxis protein
VAFELELLDFKVDLAADGLDGYEKAKAVPYSLIISDIQMPNWGGAKLLQEIRKDSCDVPPVILMTGFADIALPQAFEMGADGFLGKPLKPDQLATAVRALLLAPEERLSQSVAENPKHHIIDGEEKYCELGRRGFFLGGSIDPAVFREGDLASFDLTLSDDALPFKSLKGSGYVRWTRTRAEEGLLPGIGLEIFQLVEPDPSTFLNCMNSRQIIASIPYGRSSHKS